MKYSFLKDNLVLIVPNNIKNDILEELNKSKNLLDIKLMTREELKKKFYFDYDNQAIYYLVSKYNIKPSIAKIYIENMYYVKNTNYNSYKLNYLVKLKQELENNKLLIKDNYLKNYLKNKKIVVYGYDNLNKFYINLLKQLELITTVEIIEKSNINNYNHKVYEFQDITSEIDFIANKIIELVNSGIEINNIKLANVSNEYIYSIYKIFNFYNIPVILNNNTSILETRIGSNFIKKLNECLDIDQTLEFVTQNFNVNDEENLDILNKIINICNNYYFEVINPSIIECIKYDFKNILVKNKLLKNYIGEITLENNIIDDKLYIFLLGFNQGSIPKIFKDEDYINDNLKSNLELENTLEKNIIAKNVMINIIKNIKNLIITYKLRTSFEEYHKSLLIEELNLEVQRPNVNLEVTYSSLYEQIKLCSYLDEFVKFNKLNDNISILYSNYNNIKYLKYDNKFNGIDKNSLYEFLDQKLLLSYSSIDKFYRCKFRYYINNILKLEKYEETFPIFIGNLFHYILSLAFNSNFDFEKEWNNYIEQKVLSNKEKFFLNKLKSELLFIIETIKNQMKRSSFDKGLYEQKIFINKNKNIKVTFMGVVDKILYKEESNKTLVAIIDYKTGNPEANIYNTIYGIEMQLPVYLYLIKNSKLSNVEIAGFYLQKILNSETILKTNTSKEDMKRENLKLMGYSNSNEEILSEFDNSYKDSEIIKSMKVSNNGFYSYSKVISNEEIDKLSEIVDLKIDEAINEILNANFEIDPKRIGLKNYGCEFCKYKDICFMTEKDIVDLEPQTNLDFLKVGDDNEY